MAFFARLNPALRTLLPTIGAAYAIQGAVAAPCIIFQTDKYYDLSGSLTYFSCTALSLILPLRMYPKFNEILAGESIFKSLTRLHPRKALLSILITVWAGRLGYYLYERVKKSGGDSRFDEIKKEPLKFFGAFMAQATWVSLVGLPIFAINAIPNSKLPAFSLLDLVGITIWITGFALEVIADRQKAEWVQAKKSKKHSEDFIHSGVWSSVSRFPNYTGESTLWIGNALIAAGGFLNNGTAGSYYGVLPSLAMCAISPAFITFLLLKVSGVPLSEGKYDRKLSGNKEYEEWKKNTPKIMPKIFRF